jgi:hypothetical protein
MNFEKKILTFENSLERMCGLTDWYKILRAKSQRFWSSIHQDSTLPAFWGVRGCWVGPLHPWVGLAASAGYTVYFVQQSGISGHLLLGPAGKESNIERWPCRKVPTAHGYCFLSSLPPPPPAATTEVFNSLLSSFYYLLSLYRGFAYPYDWRGCVGGSQKGRRAWASYYKFLEGLPPRSTQGIQTHVLRIRS